MNKPQLAINFIYGYIYTQNFEFLHKLVLVAIKTIYTKAGDFYKGFVDVVINGKTTLINKFGKTLIDTKFGSFFYHFVYWHKFANC